LTTTPLVAPAPLAGRRLSAKRTAFALVVLVVFAIAVLPVALDLARRAGLYGVTQYDDGVYFAASLRLISGVLPYRDFVLVQPPGITELLAPFALASHVIGGRHAIALARIATMLVVGLNAALVAVVLRHRGLVPALVGGLALGLYPTAYAADHTFLLEPFLVLFSLLGVVLVFSGGALASDRRILIGGIAFGIAGAVKSFAIVPFVILLVLVTLRSRRAAAHLLVGAAIAVAILVAPFVIAAPHAFFHDVISSQAARQTIRPTPFLNRVFAITGLAYSSGTLTLPADNGAVAFAGAALLGVFVLGGLVPLVAAGRRGRRPELLVWFVLLTSIGVVGIMFLPPVLYDHYTLYSAAFLALALGVITARLVDGLASLDRRLSGDVRRFSRIGAGAVTVIGLGVASVAVLSTVTSYDKVLVDKFGDPGPAIAAVIPNGTCVLTDAETVLVSAGRAGTGPAGCPAIVDATGTWLSVDPDHPPVSSGLEPKDPALVAFWQKAFGQADYVVFSGVKAFRIPFTPALRSWFAAHFTEIATKPLSIYRNDVVPPGKATPTG
jgi:hypothetical protein